jgi:glycosyltransferase involved in cell wall biosynthesis
VIIFWLSVGTVVYAYAGYPILLHLLVRTRRQRTASTRGSYRPAITVTIPVYNGAANIADAIEHVLACPYAGSRQILVISDGSTDVTTSIVQGYAARGVELFELATRVGKTEAENLAIDRLRGEIIINTDASVRLHPGAIGALVEAMADPTVGVASSVDVSVEMGQGKNEGEVAYVGYEMRVRDLETAAGGIVGASGSLYAIRASLHRRVLPAHLSRDFAAALHARSQGYRAVSVPDAICFVPRGRARGYEYQRKVRTMARGLATLFAHAELLDPRRYGRFSWMLISHKLIRWLTPVALAALILAALWPGIGTPPIQALVLVGGVAAALGWWWPGRSAPRILTIPAYAMAAVVAGLHAWWRVFTCGANATWEPTRRVATTLPDDRA